jgi:hypothetical protein
VVISAVPLHKLDKPPPVPKDPDNRPGGFYGRRSGSGGGGGSGGNGGSGDRGNGGPLGGYPNSGPNGGPGAGGPQGGGGNGGNGGGAGGVPGGQGGPESNRNDYHVIKLDSKINLKHFIKWDGGAVSAIKWIHAVKCLAAESQLVEEYLGHHLVHTFEEDSQIMRFWDTLSFGWKSHMKSHWTLFVGSIRELYLTPRWENNMEAKYQAFSFRQDGHHKESPLDFINRCVRWSRALNLAPEGSAIELNGVMRCALSSWNTVLDLSGLSSLLYSAQYNQDQLVALARVNNGSFTSTTKLSERELLKMLKDVGVHIPNRGSRRTDSKRFAAIASGGSQLEAVEENKDKGYSNGSLDEKHITEEANAEIYAAYRSKPHAKPKEYMKLKRDDIVSATGTMPPSPCRQCRSSKHWHRECLYYDQYKKSVKKTVNYIASEQPYIDSYSHAVNKSILLAYILSDEDPEPVLRASIKTS